MSIFLPVNYFVQTFLAIFSSCLSLHTLWRRYWSLHLTRNVMRHLPSVRHVWDTLAHICFCFKIYLWDVMCVCVLRKIDNALAQVLYILFSYNKHHQIKQITQIKINKYRLLIRIIKINTKKGKLKYD